jgi:hypothetical protein
VSFSGKIADLFIDFAVRGAENVKAAFAEMKQGLDELREAANIVGGHLKANLFTSLQLISQEMANGLIPHIEETTSSLLREFAAMKGLTAAQAENLRRLIDHHGRLSEFQEKLESVSGSLKGLASVGRTVFAGLTSTLGGFVTAGLATSAMGEMLTFRMGVLSRTLAGLFRPEIERVINAVKSVTSWFNGLSNAQRANIVHWAEAAFAAAGIAIIMPKIVAGITAVVAGVKGLTAALIGLETGTGLGAIVAGVTAIASAITALAIGTETGRNAFSKLWEAIQPVWDMLKEVGGALWDAFSPAFEILGDIVSVVADVGGAILKAFGPAVQGVLWVVKKALEGIAWVIRQMKEGLESLLGIHRKPHQEQEEDRGPLAPSVGGIGSITAAWDRIAQASIRTDSLKGTPEETLEVLREIRDDQRDGNNRLGRLNGAFAGS